MVDLSRLFAEQQASQIDWHGAVFGLYELPPETGNLTLRMQARARSPRQGVRLKVRGGQLEANGVLATDLVLWEDASPDEFDVRVHWNPRGARTLRIWNCWEVNGVTHAWLGNAGMRVEATPPGLVVLRCSDGHGEPSFDDLVVHLRVDVHDSSPSDKGE